MLNVSVLHNISQEFIEAKVWNFQTNSNANSNIFKWKLKNVELEKTEKTQKVQSRYQIIISETWTLYLILNTWVVEDIYKEKQVGLLGKNQS